MKSPVCFLNDSSPSPIWCNVVQLRLFSRIEQHGCNQEPGVGGEPEGVSVGTSLSELSSRGISDARGDRPAEEGLSFLGGSGRSRAIHREQVAHLQESVIMKSSAVSVFEPRAVQHLDGRRLSVNKRMDPSRKSELGQFLTPDRIAEFMAALFSPPAQQAHLLDAGAGIGSLTAAFLNRWGTAVDVHVTAYEVDPILLDHLQQTLAGSEAEIKNVDFIQDAAYQVNLGGRQSRKYTHAILNPPYKKINSDSQHRALLRAVGLETVNLYTGFVGLSLELMADSGEVVAIIPRSFCNGLYYKPFREWILSRAALEHIHLFHSRTSAFNDDEVLQENVIIKLVRGRPQGDVIITTSSDTSFSDLSANSYRFEDIVQNLGDQNFIHIPTTPNHTAQEDVPLACKDLKEIGLEVSTGPIVDFRLKEFLRPTMELDAVPLLYPTHFANGLMEWPRQSKKPNAIALSPETQRWLYPNGFYTVVRRFSSKEERRRIVANVVSPEAFGTNFLGFENHLNVFHSRKQGIDKDIAHGLAVFLNSTSVDDYFRRFSGHTQVNATDLRQLRYPAQEQLKQLGRWAQSQSALSQESIDFQIKRYGRRQ